MQLGSIQKYRPQKRPSPYNRDQMVALQGFSKTGAVPTTGTLTPISMGKRTMGFGNQKSRQNSLAHNTVSTNMQAAAFLEKFQENAGGDVFKQYQVEEVKGEKNVKQVIRQKTGNSQATEIISSRNTKREDGYLDSQNSRQTSFRQPNQIQAMNTFNQEVRFETQNEDFGKSGNGLWDKNQNSVSPSLYSSKHQLGNLGKQIHNRTNEPQRVKMHFGSPEKISGFGATPRAIGFTKANSLMTSKRNSKNDDATQFGQKSGRRNNSFFNRTQQPPQQNLQNVIRSQTAGDAGATKVADGDLGFHQTETLIGDTYLPALRNFHTTMRAPKKSQHSQITDYKRTQQNEAQKPMIPKLINTEKINNKRTASLFDRQRNILLHAQMQKPVKRDKSQIKEKSRFKDWVIKEVEVKVKEKEGDEDFKAKQQGANQDSKAEGEGSQSSDHYDPLADSDGSSDYSDSPETLNGAGLQQVIRQEMKEKNNPKLHNTAFWKSLVCMDDKQLDENGKPIHNKNKKELTSFQMIKKMMRLKQQQEAVTEEEKSMNFVPQVQPQFTADGKDKYYFDMKNNQEHYELLTSDMTDEKFAIYEDREKLRADAMHHTRQFMQQLVESKIQENAKISAERKAKQNKKIDTDQLGEYQSVLFSHEKEGLFDDDDEMVFMQILMDTSERQQAKQASKKTVSKLHNKKNMFCPTKTVQMNEFARDILNGIIWDDVRSKKVHPKVLFKMGIQQKFGINITKQMLRNQKLNDLNRELSVTPEDVASPTLRFTRDEEKDNEHERKELFQQSQKKQQFFEVAKQMNNNQEIQDDANISNAKSYMRFFEKCQKSGTLALPIFSQTQDQVLSIVGQYISEGTAQAMAEVLRNVSVEYFKKPGLKSNIPKFTNENNAPYIAIREINLDDNGLKDKSFAYILNAISTQQSLKRISYVNNEIGANSIKELEKMLSPDSEGALCDLRINRVKSTKHDLNQLLKALSKSNQPRLVRLRISHVMIDEFVLMESLKKMVYNITQIQELNLQSINIHGRQFSELMEVISDNCGQVQYLNLSQNTVPLNVKWQDNFLTHLVSMINTSSKLIDINLSGMNLRENVKAIQWPLAKSKTIQSIHLSDNNIPKAYEINMLMVFGVKSNDEDLGTSIAGKLDPRLLKKNVMTGFHIKMQQKIEERKLAKIDTLNTINVIEKTRNQNSETPNMIQTYDEAAAVISNAVELRDMKSARNYMNSYMQGGLGRGKQSVQPLVITRKLGHAELIFNETDTKNSHFALHASTKWQRMQGSECWICDQWKYTCLFFSRSECLKNYGEITDEEKIEQLEKTYDLNQDDKIMVNNKKYPLLLGSIAQNTVVQMCDIAMFNLFLDEKSIKKNLGNQGERAMQAVLSVSQGMKMKFGQKLSVLNNQDWLMRFKENLPFPENEMLILNLPDSNVSQKVKKGESLTTEETKMRKDESVNDIFVFAGFVEPGKHQIIIKDQQSGKYYAREIVIDQRRPQIINCHQHESLKNPEVIKRFSIVDNETGQTTTVVDLDSSVFMNFKRYTKVDVANCFEADMRSSDFESVIKQEEEIVACATILEQNYASYCQVFHELAAQFAHFPLIDLKDLPEVLKTIGMFNSQTDCDQTAERVIAQYRESLQNEDGNRDENAELLNRVKFLKVWLMSLLYHNDIRHENHKLESKFFQEFHLDISLSDSFIDNIIPFLNNKKPDQVATSLNAFKDRFVWIDNVNSILQFNLEGIMDVFAKFAEDIGFTIKSAEKVLKGIGCLVPARMVAMQFDLAQMTVIDESINAEEYSDMEFVEFLEFLVRIAFQQYLGENRPIEKKLADFCTELLTLSNTPYVQPPQSKDFQPQASNEDIVAFHEFLNKK